MAAGEGGGRAVAKDLKITLLYDFYGQLLTEKQREAIELYYQEDLSLGEIALNTGVTRQGVRDNIKRAEAQLLELEEALGLAARFSELGQKAGQIAAWAAEIGRINRRQNGSPEVGRLAGEIEQMAGQLAQ